MQRCGMLKEQSPVPPGGYSLSSLEKEVDPGMGGWCLPLLGCCVVIHDSDGRSGEFAVFGLADGGKADMGRLVSQSYESRRITSPIMFIYFLTTRDCDDSVFL